MTRRTLKRRQSRSRRRVRLAMKRLLGRHDWYMMQLPEVVVLPAPPGLH